MSRLGFLIDNRRCIGCHACTVACKQEHDVPLGHFRTWVKYVETGTFPSTQRRFSVMRCNHCERPPCVAICPVTALYKRDDGIVDFDPEVCIGCGSCMQACPYDALFIHPGSGAAHKCNFCAHRIEAGREPPCVTVCPEQAIVMGDLDDPDAIIAGLIREEKTTWRSPEKATRPQLRYIEGEPVSLRPLAAPPQAEYMWSQATTPPFPLAPGEPVEEILGRRTYDTGHERAWGWKVSAYLWTKSLASGFFLAPALLWMLGALPRESGLLFGGTTLALLFLGITAALLVSDLERPHLFHTILTRPQWKSWLVLGTFVLTGYGGVLGLTWLGHFLAFRPAIADVLLIHALPLAALTAAYTAWLFEQCEGRDLWHGSRELAWHLGVQALLAGSAGCLLLLVPWSGPAHIASFKWIIIVALALDLAWFFPARLGPSPALSPAAQEAARIITRGRLAILFWAGVVVAGHLLALALLLTPFWILNAAGALLALAGLAVYEHVFVVAGQAIPLS